MLESDSEDENLLPMHSKPEIDENIDNLKW